MFGCSSEAWKAEVTKGLVRPPRYWACWRQMVATLWGGLCCTKCLSICIPTATLGYVAQNCPRRITMLRSPATRETAFEVLINPCDRDVCSRSVAVGLRSERVRRQGRTQCPIGIHVGSMKYTYKGTTHGMGTTMA